MKTKTRTDVILIKQNNFSTSKNRNQQKETKPNTSIMKADYLFYKYSTFLRYQTSRRYFQHFWEEK